MNENDQNRNTINTNDRIEETHEYINLYLHPWNDDRIAYYMQALIIATLIFENNDNESVERMVNILNFRLDCPLTSEEQEYTLNLLQRGISEGLL